MPDGIAMPDKVAAPGRIVVPGKGAMPDRGAVPSRTAMIGKVAKPGKAPGSKSASLAGARLLALGASPGRIAILSRDVVPCEVAATSRIAAFSTVAVRF